MAQEFSTAYVRDAEKTFHYYKQLAERAIAQVPDEALTRLSGCGIEFDRAGGEAHGREHAFPLG